MMGPTVDLCPFRLFMNVPGVCVGVKVGRPDRSVTWMGDLGYSYLLAYINALPVDACEGELCLNSFKITSYMVVMIGILHSLEALRKSN